MKKENKKLVLGIVIGGLVFGSIGVCAATYFSADQIKFTPTDESWNVDNVQDAMNTLYTLTSDTKHVSVFSDSQLTKIQSGWGTQIYSLANVLPDNYKSITLSNISVQWNAIMSNGTSYGSVSNCSYSYNATNGYLTMTNTDFPSSFKIMIAY